MDKTHNTVLNLFQSDGKPKIIMAEMCKQEGINDCGLFAIAAATALAFGSKPARLQQSNMRQNLLKCIKDGIMTLFPIV